MLYFYRFLAKNTSMSTFSGFSSDLFLVTTFPAVLNMCSDDELVALMHRYFLLSLDKAGYDAALSFHQTRGSSVESCWAACRYLSTSSRVCVYREGIA